VCVLITAVPIRKLFAWGEGDSGGHVLRETTSRGLCGLVCPSQPSTLRLILNAAALAARRSNFALHRQVECRALETKLVRLVALRWHSIGSEVRLGLPVGL